jgi:hypothetical protein
MALIAPPPPVHEIEQGVIEEAQRRQRRRRSFLAAVLLSGTILGIGLYLGSGSKRHSIRPARAPASNATSGAAQSAAGMFSREPGMGVACHVPNSIACDRVGVAVWLRRPAVAVSATVDGAPLRLNDRELSGPAHNGRRTMFVGFLQPAGLLNGPLKVRPDAGRYYWIGSHPLFARVRIIADYGHGQLASVIVGVQVSPGMG